MSVEEGDLSRLSPTAQIGYFEMRGDRFRDDLVELWRLAHDGSLDREALVAAVDRVTMVARVEAGVVDRPRAGKDKQQ